MDRLKRYGIGKMLWICLDFSSYKTLDYGSLMHLSSLDVYSYAVPEDLMQASAIIATCV